MLRPRLLVLVAALVGCASAESPVPAAEDGAALGPDEYRSGDPAAAPEPPPVCPLGTERTERGGEGPESTDWWCMRDGEVRHGPFHTQDFDERERTWYDIRGRYREGQLDGRIDHGGFYEVGHSGSSRDFRRDVYDRGRLVRSNEARHRFVLDREHPVVSRSIRVAASGLSATAHWEGDVDAVGTLDAIASTAWTDAPVDADPSVLRVSVSAPWGGSATRADGLLYPLEAELRPRIASRLPIDDLPTASTTWRRCDLDGCEFSVNVMLRWIVPGDGRLEVDLTFRAVPDVWPEAAPVEVRVEDR